MQYKISSFFSLFALFAFVSCNNSPKESATSGPSNENTAPVVEEVVVSRDTLRATSESLSQDGNSLSATGSNLTADVSNLNMDVQLASDQLFDFDKSTLKPEAEEVLNQVATDLQAMGTEPVRITGHTDSKGDNNYNKKLSEARANSVKDWFVKKGLKNKFITEGKGEEDPIAPNTTSDGKDSEEGRSKNRRVEVKYLGTQSISK